MVTMSDRYQGFVGVVVKRGRTRFHVRGSGSLLTVPFDHVEAAQVPRVQEIWRSRGWLEG